MWKHRLFTSTNLRTFYQLESQLEEPPKKASSKAMLFLTPLVVALKVSG